MFDLTSSKLLILAVIALIVVGPKDLPVLLRAIGKYVGIVRRQANEFRQYFDEAMRENELASLKAEVDAMKRDVQATVSSAGRALEADIDAVKSDIETVKSDVAAVKSEVAAASSDAAPPDSSSDIFPGSFPGSFNGDGHDAARGTPIEPATGNAYAALPSQADVPVSPLSVLPAAVSPPPAELATAKAGGA
ncbi:MAG: Sec-independent protein translocase protein TatB [Hyphomicrobium aestuarii]|nr:Sec-independent protein translocase protein TatB [Hyphomicrobium aestuarii]